MKRVLVVDDDSDVREALAIVLEESFDITTAADGQDALRHLRAGHFDAVVLDLMMPVLDGAGVVAAMRAGAIDVPVVLGSASLELAAEHRRLGVADCLGKPYDMALLERKLRALTGG